MKVSLLVTDSAIQIQPFWGAAFQQSLSSTYYGPEFGLETINTLINRTGVVSALMEFTV